MRPVRMRSTEQRPGIKCAVVATFFIIVVFVAVSTTLSNVLQRLEGGLRDRQASGVSSIMQHHPKDPRGRPPLGGRQIWTVVSTQCSPFQDWNVIVAANSHQRLAIPGRFVRLLACNDDSYEVPAPNYDKFSVFRHRDYEIDHKDDPFRKSALSTALLSLRHTKSLASAPRLKALALRDWLAAVSGDLADNDVVILLDPDQIFLGHPNTTSVENGHAQAAAYALNTNFLSVAAAHCHDSRCKVRPGMDMSNLLYGAPYIMTVHDAKLIAAKWSTRTELFRQDKPIADQFVSCCVGVRIRHSSRLNLALGMAYRDVRRSPSGLP